MSLNSNFIELRLFILLMLEKLLKEDFLPDGWYFQLPEEPRGIILFDEFSDFIPDYLMKLPLIY